MTNRRNSTGDGAVKSHDRRRNSDSSVEETVLFQPWFVPQHIAYAIHGLVPPLFWRKMRYFFDDYGCLICGVESGYHSNGMCGVCYPRIRKKMMLSVKRRSRSNPRQRLDLVLFRQEKLAGKLLGRFSRGRRRGRGARRTEPERCNPVYEALSARFE
jgi:hypothetical protein